VYDTAGSQVSLGELRAEVEALGVGGRVGFTGFVQDAAAAIRALDVVVHASTDPEPFGLVIIEAMACGRPVVVSEAGGAAELVTPGVDAVTHAPGDEAALARRIAELAADAATRHRLGLAGRATAERSFGRRRMVSELLDVYHDLAASAPSRHSPDWPNRPGREPRQLGTNN
jgi:glycosyltransferase involved in cell wall biosynthesis